MYTRVEKPKEKKNLSVANYVAQKKTGMKQDSGFVDNRLTNRVAGFIPDNSVRNTITIGGGRKAAIQRRELDRNRLNMVGEQHPESDARREEEKDLVESKGINRDHYWKENEYIYSVDESWRLCGLLIRRNIKRYYGDPVILRVEKHLADTKEKLLPLVQQFSIGNSPDVLGVPDLQTAWNSFIDVGIRRELGQILATIHQVMGTGEDRYQRRLLPLHTLIQTNYTALGVRSLSLSDVAVTNEARAIIRVINEAEAFFTRDIKGGRPLASVDQTDRQRSVKMDEAAKASNETSGVWKVGQSHVDDIKSDPDYDEHALIYNLVTRDEFNEKIAQRRQELRLQSDARKARSYNFWG